MGQAIPELASDPSELDGIPEEEIITVVTGLPRSGTSLMMQILDAAGIPPFTDEKRVADESNQKGYYEHEKVAALMKPGDQTWLLGAKGKAIKIVAPLLAGLPPDLKYRILFMERDIEEILSSQSAMLKRMGKKAPTGEIKKATRQQVRFATE